ncbi:MAG: thiamine ABC transporter substrate-binding protein, partial [Spirochaetales bacterium]|nr:thiamine ABC transporter substrate-binding protein [Spirochaetales bacterium]
AMNHKDITFKTAAFIFIGVLIFLYIGCGEKRDDGESRRKPLVVYTYDTFPEALEVSIQELFPAHSDTDVSIERFTDTGALISRVLIEKENPKADVVIGLDNTYISQALSEELFQSYKPKGLQLVSPGLLVDDEYRLIPFDYGSIALNYNSDMLPDPPSSWDDLLDPVYKNSIILMNPATSSPGKNFLLFTISEFGENGYLDFWKALKPNILTVTSGWSEGYGLYTQGEAPIVLSYDTSPAYHMHYEQVDKYRNLLFEQRAYAQIEVAGIVTGAKNLSAARELMDHIVSVDFQELIPLNQIMYPIHPDAQLPDAFARANGAEIIVNMDEKIVAEKFEKWLTDWEQVMR